MIEYLYIASMHRECYKEQIDACGYFFINRDGCRLSEQSVRLIINKYTNLAGIPNHITPHMFRHSFATLLLEEDSFVLTFYVLLPVLIGRKCFLTFLFPEQKAEWLSLQDFYRKEVSEVWYNWFQIFRQNIHVILFCFNVRSIEYLYKGIGGISTELL